MAVDVGTGYVSVEEARRTYGVVLTNDGEVDRAATETRRAEVREERLSAEPWEGE